MVVIMFSF